ncbi:integrase, catalytic region, zinc finger, CCHC-type containing protein, partial [Tanacetum coccineum]
KEAAKFVRDFQSLANEADKSIPKHKALELEIERLLRAIIIQDIMYIVQNNSVVDTSNLQTELDRTKERLKNCIIKKENEYAKLWNDLYKKCEECKYDKISYNDMQQKIKRLQAKLGDLKGKCEDTLCVSDTLDPLPQKLENENVELEFQVWNYEKENAHLKTAYKNLFDSINVTQAQTKTIIDSLQNKLHDMMYENAKLRAQLFDKVSEQKDTIKGTSMNTKFANQSTKRKPSLQSLRNNFVARQPNAFQSERTKFSKTRVSQKVDEMNDLSNLVTSNSVPTPQESKVVKNDNVITLGMFRINPSKTSREDKFVPINKVRASIRTNPITVSQPHVITKKKVISDSNGTVRFGNDHVAAILDLEVAFRRNTCFFRNLEGVDLLKGNRTTNLYTINLYEMASASPICLMARATSTKSWLWHQRLSHLNFDTINDLAKNDLVIDDYSRYMWVHFLRSKDESPEEIKTFLKKITVLLQAPVINNDREDIGKLGAKGDIGFFIGYSANSCAYRVYNRRTKKIMETMNMTFDELSAMASEQSSSKPRLQSMTSGQIGSRLDLTYAPSTITTQQPTERELDLLFKAMYDDYIGGQPSAATRTAPAAQAPQVLQTPTTSTTIQQDNQASLQPEIVADNVSNDMLDGNTFVNPFAPPSISAAESSSSQYTKDHPLEQVIGEPSPPFLTRNQLQTDGDMCMYALTVSTMELRNVKEAMTDPAWIESMQEELL